MNLALAGVHGRFAGKPRPSAISYRQCKVSNVPKPVTEGVRLDDDNIDLRCE
jgi:hypothetical protein